MLDEPPHHTRRPSSCWCRRASPWTPRWRRARPRVAEERETQEREREGARRRPLLTFRRLSPLSGSESNLFPSLMCSGARAARRLRSLLSAGDVIVDGGNEWYENTERRERELQASGILYLGCGVSGGRSPAHLGKSIHLVLSSLSRSHSRSLSLSLSR